MGIELGLQKNRNFKGDHPISCRYLKFAGKVKQEDFQIRFMARLISYFHSSCYCSFFGHISFHSIRYSSFFAVVELLFSSKEVDFKI